MKTLMNRIVSTHQNVPLALPDWSSGAITSQLVHPQSWPKKVRPIKIPALRIVLAPNEDLFKYAVAARARSGFWETVVFAVLGVSAVGALAMAFLGV